MFSLAPRGLAIARLGCARALRTQRPAIFHYKSATLLSQPIRPTTSRLLSNLSNNKPTTTTNPPIKLVEKVQQKPQEKEEVQHLTKAEQRRSDWAIIKQLLANVWPKNDWRTRGTVLLGFVLLISAKVRGWNGYINNRYQAELLLVIECSGAVVI
jgi:hypothetical protein